MHFSYFDLIALPIVGQGVMSLRDGVAYLKYCRESEAARYQASTYTPRAAVLVPCKGLDEGLRRSLNVLSALDYPSYELIFMVESTADDAHPLLHDFCARQDGRARLVVAGRTRGMGQKVHNLLCGLKAVGSGVEVLAFLDSDVVLRPDWLRSLVAPLKDPEVGTATGYRWYSLETGGLATIFRSAWNGSIATALGPHRKNFAWGGSMAIRRADFEAFGVADHWRGAVSDDYALTQAVKQSGHFITFVPACLVVSPGTLSLAELLEFTTRQIIITRIYSPLVWKVALGWYAFYNLALYSLAVRGGWRAAGGEFALAQVFLAVMFALSFAKSVLTLAAIRTVLGVPAVGNLLRRAVYGSLGPLTATLFAYNLLASCFTRRIVWRGVRYELRSPNETVILPK